jgi:transaldolase
MKIFIDSANIKEIKQANDWGIVDGVTTNPSLISHEKGDFKTLISEILTIIDGPVSVEVISTQAEGMIKEALSFSKWSKNVVIKIPLTPEGLKAVKILNGRKINTNATLVFSANQAILAAKAGATYVSPFIGRLDDAGHDGMQVIRDIVKIYQNYGFVTEVIVASIRHPLHVTQSAIAGAHVATIPFSVIERMFIHPQTTIGLEKFLKDWEKVKNT